MKTLRFALPVHEDVHGFLDLVTDVEGVVAAMLHEGMLLVAVASEACALLVREEVEAALLASAA